LATSETLVFVIKPDRLTSATDRRHVELLLDVARRYYEGGQGQAQIARAVGYSRPTVSRLLAEARQRGVVKVSISHPLERLQALEGALADRFSLKAVRVAESGVERCAAALLVESAREDSLITVSNGQAVAATVAAVPETHWPASRVVQMIGMLGPVQASRLADALTDSPEVCGQLARRLGGSFHALAVPLVLSTAAVAAALRSEEPIAAALALGGRADIALVGVGAVTAGRSGTIFEGFEGPRTEMALAASGAVAHICGHHVSAAGEHLPTPLCGRTISVAPERMRQIPLVIGVAYGETKVAPLRAVIRGRFINALVTDRPTAEALLAE
jgi:DNA-binding transcriptional regulator LsrR (DeoR family)